MKNFSKMFMMMLAAAAFVSCSDDPEQPLPPVPTPDVVISVSDVTYSTVTINTKANDDVNYVMWVWAKSEFKNMNDEQIKAEMKKQFQEVFDKYGKRTGLHQLGLCKGNHTVKKDQLKVEHDYLVGACVLDMSDTTLTDEVYKTPFKTAVLPHVDLSFTMAETDSSFIFTPSDTAISYFAIVASEKEMKEANITNIKDMMGFTVALVKEMGISHFPDILKKGNFEFPKNSIEPGAGVYDFGGAAYTNDGYLRSTITTFRLPSQD